MTRYEPPCGTTIEHAAVEMVKLAYQKHGKVTAEFNDIELEANPGTNPQDIIGFFTTECNRRHEAYITSDKYRRDQEEYAQRQDANDAALKSALALAPKRMALKDQDLWNKQMEANTDDYGRAALRYAETWARLMELRIANGDTLKDSAEETSHLADTEGITGFMYGCAVSVLSHVWIHGEALRKWHNLKTQLGHEGERANERGGTLNPALLTLNMG